MVITLQFSSKSGLLTAASAPRPSTYCIRIPAVAISRASGPSMELLPACLLALNITFTAAMATAARGRRRWSRPMSFLHNEMAGSRRSMVPTIYGAVLRKVGNFLLKRRAIVCMSLAHRENQTLLTSLLSIGANGRPIAAPPLGDLSRENHQCILSSCPGYLHHASNFGPRRCQQQRLRA